MEMAHQAQGPAFFFGSLELKAPTQEIFYERFIDCLCIQCALEWIAVYVLFPRSPTWFGQSLVDAKANVHVAWIAHVGRVDGHNIIAIGIRRYCVKEVRVGHADVEAKGNVKCCLAASVRSVHCRHARPNYIEHQARLLEDHVGLALLPLFYKQCIC
jgi:hypothetical protein